MVAETVRHGLITSRTLMLLCSKVSERLEVATGLTIIANGRNCQPDLVVFGPAHDQGAHLVVNPVVVVEVVSSSTRVMDRFDKNVDYAQTASIQHYLMLSEERPSAVLCSRVDDEWVSLEQDGADVVALSAIDVELPLGDIYRRIVFPAGAA